MGETLPKIVGVVAARLKDERQGSLGRAADLFEIDVEQRATPLAETTGDHDRIHLSALGRVDNRADCIVGREQTDVVGADHDQVRLFARCEGADTVVQPGAAGPVARRGFEDCPEPSQEPARVHRRHSGGFARRRVAARKAARISVNMSPP
jgi:hypothetical protein